MKCVPSPLVKLADKKMTSPSVINGNKVDLNPHPASLTVWQTEEKKQYFGREFQTETVTNCPANNVTEIFLKMSRDSAGGVGGWLGCLVIDVTENGSKLWSLRITRGQDLDQDTKESVFFALSQKYQRLGAKKAKMEFLEEIERVIFPHLGWECLHRKSLIRKLNTMVSRDHQPPRRRGRKAIYNDIEKGHLVRLWQLSGYPCSKRLKALLPEWLTRYGCSESIKAKLIQMSASQMDEYLIKARVEYQRKVQSGTVPAKNHIKKLIRLREPGLRHTEPGY